MNRGVFADSYITDVRMADDGRTVTFRVAHLVDSDLLVWRRGQGITSLTKGDDVWSSTSGVDLSGDGEWSVFSMVRYDLPGLNPVTDPARVVLYRTKVR